MPQNVNDYLGAQWWLLLRVGIPLAFVLVIVAGICRWFQDREEMQSIREDGKPEGRGRILFRE